eukprot:g2895.t1
MAYLLREYGDMSLQSDSGTLQGVESFSTTLRSYHDYMLRKKSKKNNSGEASRKRRKPRYGVRLMDDYDGQRFLEDFWKTIHPPYFLRRANYIRALDPQCRGLLSTIFLGLSGTGAVNHQDYMGMGRWQLQVFGSKSWILHPPSETDKMYNERVDPFNPDLSKYPRYSEAKGRIEVTVKPGEIIFWPPGWWHSTLIQEDFSFSVNEKMVHSKNYDFFAAEAKKDCGRNFKEPTKLGLSLLQCRCARDIIRMVEDRGKVSHRKSKAEL